MLVGFKAQNHPQQPKRDDVDDRASTPEVFEAIAKRLGPFTIDVAAAPHNTTEQRWWQEYVEPFRDRGGSGLTVEFLPNRMRFIRAGKDRIGPNERPPFGVCLIVWADPSAGGAE